MTRERNPRITVTIILVAIAAIFSFPLSGYLQGYGNSFLYPLGFESGLSGSLFSWVLGLVLAVGVIWFTVQNIPAVADTWLEVTPLRLLVLYVAVGAATVEEAFFRREVMDYIADRGNGIILQILVSAIIFGLAHGVWGLLKGSLAVAIRTIIATTIIGAGLAVIYIAAGRSLAPAVISHFLITFLLEPGLMLAAVIGQFGGKSQEIQKTE